MTDIDSFNKIFEFNTQKSDGAVSFHEDKIEAKITDLEIIGEGIKFNYLCDTEIKKMARIWDSKCIYAKDADGITIFSHNGINKMVVCELKSSFGQLNGAFKQALGSYIKLIMYLSICKDFEISNYEVYFVFTSCPLNSKSLDCISQLQEKAKTPEGLNGSEKFLLKIYQKKKISFDLSECKDILGDVLHDKILKQKVVCIFLDESNGSEYKRAIMVDNLC